MDITLIIVSFKSENLIHKNIKNLNSNLKIIIIENSNDSKMKENIEKKYENVKVILNQNKGFGQAANLGAKLANTKYLLFCSPDNFLEKNFIQKLDQIINNSKDKLDMLVLTNFDQIINTKKKIETPKGISCFLLEKKIFFNQFGFDENFFLYYEDIDFLKRFLTNKLYVYQIPVYYTNHSGSHDKEFNKPVEINRNWHYMWSKFYFNKKHNGYIYAFCVTIPFFIRSIIKSIIYVNNENKRKIYLSRASGLFNSYMLKKSWYRPQIK